MRIEISDGDLSVEESEEGSVTIEVCGQGESTNDPNDVPEDKEPPHAVLARVGKKITKNDSIDLAAWLMTFALMEESGDEDAWKRFEETHQQAMLQITREARIALREKGSEPR